MMAPREVQRSPFTPASSVSPAGSVRVHEDSSPWQLLQSLFLHGSAKVGP